MRKQDFISSFPWALYSEKLADKILHPRCAGSFSQGEALAKGMRLVQGKEGSIEEGNLLHFDWLVDEHDGVIVDCRFQVFGHSALIGAAQAAAEMLAGKNYRQAERIHADHIDHFLRDKHDVPAFPKETSAHLNLALDAIYQTAQQCSDIAIEQTPPTPFGLEHTSAEERKPHPQWGISSQSEKITLIEEVLDAEIRPYIALDAGGVEVLDLVNDFEVLISYQGACTSCSASTGSTLSAMQKILREHVHPQIVVTPDLTDLMHFDHTQH